MQSVKDGTERLFVDLMDHNINKIGFALTAKQRRMKSDQGRVYEARC